MKKLFAVLSTFIFVITSVSAASADTGLSPFFFENAMGGGYGIEIQIPSNWQTIYMGMDDNDPFLVELQVPSSYIDEILSSHGDHINAFSEDDKYFFSLSQTPDYNEFDPLESIHGDDLQSVAEEFVAYSKVSYNGDPSELFDGLTCYLTDVRVETHNGIPFLHYNLYYDAGEAEIFNTCDAVAFIDGEEILLSLQAYGDMEEDMADAFLAIVDSFNITDVSTIAIKPKLLPIAEDSSYDSKNTVFLALLLPIVIFCVVLFLVKKSVSAVKFPSGSAKYNASTRKSVTKPHKYPYKQGKQEKGYIDSLQDEELDRDYNMYKSGFYTYEEYLQMKNRR